jgi:hypothetical protein
MHIQQLSNATCRDTPGAKLATNHLPRTTTARPVELNTRMGDAADSHLSCSVCFAAFDGEQRRPWVSSTAARCCFAEVDPY